MSRSEPIKVPFHKATCHLYRVCGMISRSRSELTNFAVPVSGVVSGPLSSDRSNDRDQAIAHSASFPCGSTASSFQSLPVSNSFEMPERMAIRAQQNCVTSSVSTQEMDHPVLAIAFPNDEEVEYSSLRPEHFKNAAKRKEESSSLPW